MRRRLWLGVALGSFAASCREQPAGPPTETTSATPAPKVCEPAPALDRASIGISPPLRSAGLCIDPNGELRSYGESSMRELEEACGPLLGSSCDDYRQHGLRRVWTWRYVDGRGGAAAVVVHAFRFGGRDAAYAVFTRWLARQREVASSVRGLPARGEAAQVGALAHLWRGPYVVELSYQDEQQAPAQVQQAAQSVLPPLVLALSEHLEGRVQPPEAVRRLPPEERVELAIDFTPRDAFGVPGLGAAAVGAYRRGDRPYRVLIAVRRDPQRIDDLIDALRRLPGYRKLKAMPFRAFQLHRPGDSGEPSIEWLVGAHQQRLVAVGNVRPRRALGGPPEMALSEHDKLKLLRRVLTDSASEK